MESSACARPSCGVFAARSRKTCGPPERAAHPCPPDSRRAGRVRGVPGVSCPAKRGCVKNLQVHYHLPRDPRSDPCEAGAGYDSDHTCRQACAFNIPRSSCPNGLLETRFHLVWQGKTGFKPRLRYQRQPRRAPAGGAAAHLPLHPHQDPSILEEGPDGADAVNAGLYSPGRRGPAGTKAGTAGLYSPGGPAGTDTGNAKWY